MELVVFKEGGKGNTAESLRMAKRACEDWNISHMVVATTEGDTGLEAAKMLKGSSINLVVVTHNYGFKEPGVVELLPETRREIEELGATVYTGTMVLRNIGTAIRDLQGYSQQDLVANTLRILGQGMKVCVEIVAMAADAGLIPHEENVVAVAGTGRGADTVTVVYSMPSNRLFEMKVRAVLAKPWEW